MRIASNSRVVLEKSFQQKLIEVAKSRSCLTWSGLSKRLNVSRSLLREGYSTGDVTLPYRIFRNLCVLSEMDNQKITKNIEEIRDPNWGRVLGGKIGGKRSKVIIKNKIKYPIMSDSLGEFIGIILGDGSIDPKNYTVQISLNRYSDCEYVNYVEALIYKLFGVKPKIYNSSKNRVTIVRVNSKLLVEFLKAFELNRKKIPDQFAQDRRLITSLLRGLFDTDGSIHLSSKWCVLDFTNNSSLLLEFKEYLESFGIPCFISNNHVNVTSLWKIEKFMRLIGSSNLKNIIKFEEYYRNRMSLKNEDAVKLFNNYRNLELPYKLGL